jgi:hypothetical protein
MAHFRTIMESNMRHLTTALMLLLLWATSASADVTLPPTDPLIGSWCEVTGDATFLKRGPCSTATISRNGYDGEESSCTFLEVKRIQNGIEAFSECKADSLEGNTYERVTFQIFNNRLKIKDIATRKGFETLCFVVNNPPDGYLNLRKGPGMGFKVKAKLNIYEHLQVNAKAGECTYTYNVAERKSAAGQVSGWVYSKYLQEVESCHVP